MVETEEEQRSMQRWQRLQRATATEDLVVPEAQLGSWLDPAAQHADIDADEELELERSRRDPTTKGWRWLKAVSMVAFTSRPNKTTTTEMEPLYPPQVPRSDDDQSRMAAREMDIRLRSPQRRTREVDVSKLNSPQRRTATQVQPPEQAAEFGSKNSVPEVVVDVASTKTAQAGGVVHSSNSDADEKEQRGRCLKYSQKALGFAVCTFIGYAINASSSNTAFKMAIAPFFLAICADLVSLKTKGKLGSALVFFSSLHLILMTYLIFIAFDMDHAYAILFLPVVVMASHLLQKLWRPPLPPPDAQSADERSKAAGKELDNIFELSALILNWSSFVSAIMTVVRHFISVQNHNELAPGAVGLLFFLTIILGIYLMLATTVRNPALNLPTKYLDVLLICLLVGTLIAAVITFSGANWAHKQNSPAAGGSN